jgi:cyclic beta-1,2-glucan synthetase
VREDDKMALLFTPAFGSVDGASPHRPDPGYIAAYPPGVRENGGQYTHGALWLAMAFARRGDGDRAVRLLEMLSPVEHARTPQDVARYRVEPYAVAADVYALPGHVGRGGWTWYTGSAGWMYRVWVEEVLGFRLRGDTLTLDPVIPTTWEGFTLRYRHRAAEYHIRVENPARVSRGVASVTLDGRPLPDATIPLSDDHATHTIVVRLGPPS